MPELPEVETVCRGLEPAMKGRVVQKLVLRRENLRIAFPKNMAGRLEGRKILRLSRRAKYILIHVAGHKKGEGEDIVIVHLGMSGQMGVVKQGSTYAPRKHDHMMIAMDNDSLIVLNDARRFGMVMMEKAGALLNHPSFKDIGPEPLEDAFTGAALLQRLMGKKTSIKSALLDQHVVAGVGNIYACEALYNAKISPLTPAGSLTQAKAQELVDAIKDVLARAIKAGGSTLKDYKKADGSSGYFQHSFVVYGRAGQPCPQSIKNGKKGHTILKITQSGRATYYCPHCQKV